MTKLNIIEEDTNEKETPLTESSLPSFLHEVMVSEVEVIASDRVYKAIKQALDALSSPSLTQMYSHIASELWKLKDAIKAATPKLEREFAEALMREMVRGAAENSERKEP